MSGRTLEHDIFGTEPRPRGVNGKRKGNNNERVAAKFLGEWTGAKFSKTPASGGMHLRNAMFCGDLVCATEGFFFPFVVETKHLKKVTVKGALRDNSMLFKIFRQALRDANRIGKRPLCLIRGNGMDAGDYYLVLDSTLAADLKIYGGVSAPPTKRFRPVGFGTSPQDQLQLTVFMASQVRASLKWERFCRLLGITGSKQPKS